MVFVKAVPYPLYCTYYVAETIASGIHTDRFIDSYILPNGWSDKLCQSADDTIVIVTTDLALNALFLLFKRYEQAFGAN